ncbi:MAG: hypothetical protein CM15mP22_8310 [Gammaproteobacteria bacterium]|nr:MAG: hypothetical protein CM15mP22_8310 [Gammaproteobacteria bacterium]
MVLLLDIFFFKNLKFIKTINHNFRFVKFFDLLLPGIMHIMFSLSLHSKADCFLKRVAYTKNLLVSLAPNIQAQKGKKQSM